MAEHRFNITVGDSEEISVQVARKEPFRPTVLMGIGGDTDPGNPGHIVSFPSVETLAEFGQLLTDTVRVTKDWDMDESSSRLFRSRTVTGNNVQALVRLGPADRLDILAGSDVATIYTVPEALVMVCAYPKLREMERAVREELESDRNNLRNPGPGRKGLREKGLREKDLREKGLRGKNPEKPEPLSETPRQRPLPEPA